MTRKYKGLKTRMQANPIVKSVHCAYHALNLVLLQACQSSILISVFFSTLKELYMCIEGSPKHHNTFFDIPATHPAIICMLEDMIASETDTTIVSNANGLLLPCKNFELVAMLVIFCKIVQLTTILSKTLQNDDVDRAQCFQLVDSCITNLKELRACLYDPT